MSSTSAKSDSSLASSRFPSLVISYRPLLLLWGLQEDTLLMMMVIRAIFGAVGIPLPCRRVLWGHWRGLSFRWDLTRVLPVRRIEVLTCA